MLLARIAALSEQIVLLDQELRERARHDQTAKRLMTIPSIGVICAVAMEALAPPLESFAKGARLRRLARSRPDKTHQGARRA